METKNQATILIVLGVTGDLADKKILPALYNLHRKGALPKQFRLVGFGRRPFNNKTFRPFVEEVVTRRLADATPDTVQAFLADFDYVHGNLETLPSYNELATYLQKIEHSWGTAAHYMFYLSVPSEIYEPIINHIHSSKLHRGQLGRDTRILVEKPIGKDSASANQLEQLLSSNFKDEEIYRIDHYLAKEMLQNVLTFRFANDMFEKNWNKDSIEKIEMRLWEQLGVEQRGPFYDGLGALRDMGQNHLLQMLSLLTMNRPADLAAKSLHAKRAEILNKLQPLSVEQIPQHTYRAQYRGYRTIAGVVPQSNTETYFKIRGYMEDERWHGVPIIIESGKRMHQRKKEIVVTYRHQQPCWCPDQTNHHQNKITFALEPAEGINIEFWSKKPGLASQGEQRSIDFMLRDVKNKPQYIEEYEKLLLDSIIGDQTLFVSTAEVKAMWRFIDPIIEAWDRNDVPLDEYAPDTDEAVAHSLVINTRG